MMLDHLGYKNEAKQVEQAKIAVIQDMHSMQAAKMGFSTTEIGDKVVEVLKQRVSA